MMDALSPGRGSHMASTRWRCFIETDFLDTTAHTAAGGTVAAHHLGPLVHPVLRPQPTTVRLTHELQHAPLTHLTGDRRNTYYYYI